MQKLLVYAGLPLENDLAARTGGRPLAPVGLDWPVCRSCMGAMQFVGQIPLADLEDWSLPMGLLLMFMCQNSPGMCSEWDANAGGTCAMVVPLDSLSPMTLPETGRTLLGEMSGIMLQPFDGSYADCRKNWGGAPRDVLGKVGGKPDWTQFDNTPLCDDCGQKMHFVVMLEEGHDPATAANFGGGAGYGFACSSCVGKAKFLWQQSLFTPQATSAQSTTNSFDLSALELSQF